MQANQSHLFLIEPTKENVKKIKVPLPCSLLLDPISPWHFDPFFSIISLQLLCFCQAQAHVSDFLNSSLILKTLQGNFTGEATEAHRGYIPRNYS